MMARKFKQFWSVSTDTDTFWFKSEESAEDFMAEEPKATRKKRFVVEPENYKEYNQKVQETAHKLLYRW